MRVRAVHGLEKQFRGRAAGAALFAFAYSATALADDVKIRDGLDIISANGSHHFSVEVANDDATRARGLMFRTAIGDDEGMLFSYGNLHPVTLWMHDTFIPLDMVFIGGDGRISHINALAEPLSEAHISSEGDVQAVLEIKGGRAAELGIGVGDKVVHPAVKQLSP